MRGLNGIEGAPSEDVVLFSTTQNEVFKKFQQAWEAWSDLTLPLNGMYITLDDKLLT